MQFVRFAADSFVIGVSRAYGRKCNHQDEQCPEYCWISWLVCWRNDSNEQQESPARSQVGFSRRDGWLQEAGRPYVGKYLMGKIILKEIGNNNYPLDRNFKMCVCNQNSHTEWNVSRKTNSRKKNLLKKRVAFTLYIFLKRKTFCPLFPKRTSNAVTTKTYLFLK